MNKCKYKFKQVNSFNCIAIAMALMPLIIYGYERGVFSSKLHENKSLKWTVNQLYRVNNEDLCYDRFPSRGDLNTVVGPELINYGVICLSYNNYDSDDHVTIDKFYISEDRTANRSNIVKEWRWMSRGYYFLKLDNNNNSDLHEAMAIAWIPTMYDPIKNYYANIEYTFRNKKYIYNFHLTTKAKMYQHTIEDRHNFCMIMTSELSGILPLFTKGIYEPDPHNGCSITPSAK